MRYTKREQIKALDWLRGHLSPGDTVYTVLEHVSRSGMSREIRVLIPFTREDGSIDFFHPNRSVAVVLGLRQGKSDGLIVTGAGMDMGFHLVYSLAYTLWPNGFPCVGPGCPSNDHVNREDRQIHRDGGYALRQRWL